MWCVSSLRGQLIERTSDRRKRSSRSTSSIPSSAATALSANGSCAMNVMSNGFARRKTSAPILPIPSEPSVRPSRPTPMCAARFAKPAAASRVRRSFTIILLVSASMNVMTDTATGRRTPSGVMTRAIPALVQASTSTVSYPTPKRATTLSRPLFGTLCGPKRWMSRMSASKPSSCSARSGFSDSRNAISAPGVVRNGVRSKSG